MAKKSKATPAPQMGRPRANIQFAPKKAGQKKPAKKNSYADRKTAEPIIRSRLHRQGEIVDYLVEQLLLDYEANREAINKAEEDGGTTPSELLRSRQSIMTSLRTMVALQETSIMRQAKQFGFLSDLGDDGEKEGGDLIVNVQRLPDEEPPTEDPANGGSA